MIDVAKLRVGDRVHYTPFKGCNPSLIENGRVKEIPEHTNTAVRVVYSCAGEWDKFTNYASQLTDIVDLEMGWYTGETNQQSDDKESDNNVL